MGFLKKIGTLFALSASLYACRTGEHETVERGLPVFLSEPYIKEGPKKGGPFNKSNSTPTISRLENSFSDLESITLFQEEASQDPSDLIYPPLSPVTQSTLKEITKKNYQDDFLTSNVSSKDPYMVSLIQKSLKDLLNPDDSSIVIPHLQKDNRLYIQGIGPYDPLNMEKPDILNPLWEDSLSIPLGQILKATYEDLKYQWEIVRKVDDVKEAANTVLKRISPNLRLDVKDGRNAKISWGKNGFNATYSYEGGTQEIGLSYAVNF